jgi:ethanolamine utilization protein EutN
MHLARVIGSLVATVKTPGLEGIKLLVVQPLSRTLEPSGKPAVAADAVAMAGPGDLVQIVASREAAVALPQPFVPVDLAILGIVDQVANVALGAAVDASPGAGSSAPAPGAPAGRPRRPKRPRAEAPPSAQPDARSTARPTAPSTGSRPRRGKR